MAAVSEKARKAAVPLPGERTQGETIAYLLAALTIGAVGLYLIQDLFCLLYTSPSPRDRQKSRMPSSA